MGFTIDFSVLNQKGTPALYSDIFANRPAAGYQGRLFIATDTAAIYEDTGTAWTLIANVSSGAGTLQQVTTNGNTSNVGISVTAGGVSTNSATITSLTTGSVPFAGAGGLISQDNANLFWDDTNNRLGINTNTPSNSLDVHTSGTAAAIAINNTAGNQALISFLNTSAARWRIGNTAGNFFDIINVFTSTSAISINSAGNVVTLIGALNGTSSVFSSTITSTTNGSTFGNSAIGGNPLIVKANAVSRAIQLLNTLGGAAEILAIGNATSSSIGFNTIGQSDAFVIYNDGSNRSNGDVGMWGATTRNLNFFDATNNNINAQIQYSEVNSNTGQLLFNTNNSGTSATRLTISNTGAATFSNTVTSQANGSTFGTAGSTGRGLIVQAGSTNQAIQLKNAAGADGTISATGTSTSLNYSFSTYSVGDAFVILNNGNVGISTTTPEQLLTVTGGNLSVSGNTGSARQVAIITTSGGNAIFGSSYQGASSFGSLILQTSGVDRLTISSTGTATFTSGVESIQFTTNAGGVFKLFNDTNTNFWYTRCLVAGSNNYRFNYNGVDKAEINNSTGAFVPLSDINKKKDFEDSTIGLNAILGLKPTLFRMLDEEDTNKHLGFIAQEVKEFIPQAYVESGEGENTFIGLDYQAISSALVKAVQEQQTLIESLLQRIELLENK